MPFGVDEAGRGPVLGSMFAAAVWVPDRSVLPDGVDDSKRLTRARREQIADRLREKPDVTIGVVSVSPARIDEPTTDMNTLTVDAHAHAIEQLKQKLKHQTNGQPLVGRCDACDTDAERFARRVADACAVEATIEAEHGADETDPLVGAASIVAKVERDAHVDTLASEYGDVGSGYPSDPTTRAFLESYVAEHGSVPPCARRSWSTCRDVLAAAEQTRLDE